MEADKNKTTKLCGILKVVSAMGGKKGKKSHRVRGMGTIKDGLGGESTVILNVEVRVGSLSAKM